MLGKLTVLGTIVLPMNIVTGESSFSCVAVSVEILTSNVKVCLVAISRSLGKTSTISTGFGAPLLLSWFLVSFATFGVRKSTKLCRAISGERFVTFG